jgi:hypothetical protein
VNGIKCSNIQNHRLWTWSYEDDKFSFSAHILALLNLNSLINRTVYCWVLLQPYQFRCCCQLHCKLSAVCVIVEIELFCFFFFLDDRSLGARPYVTSRGHRRGTSVVSVVIYHFRPEFSVLCGPSPRWSRDVTCSECQDRVSAIASPRSLLRRPHNGERTLYLCTIGRGQVQPRKHIGKYFFFFFLFDFSSFAGKIKWMYFLYFS